MTFRMSSGGGVAGSAVITAFNETTKVVTVQARDQFGALAANGTAVDIYVDGGGSPYASGTVAGGAGLSNITLTGLNTALGHAIVPKLTQTVVVTGQGLNYTPAFGTAAFTGSQAIRKSSGGLNPTADNGAATIALSGGSATGSLSGTVAGGNYEPGGFEIVTANGSNTTPIRGKVPVLSTGALDWSNVTFSGTGPDGSALSLGSGYVGSTTTAVVSRRVTSIAAFIRMRQTTGAVNGELLLNSIGNLLSIPVLTGFKLRFDANNGVSYRATQTSNISSTDFADYFVAIDLAQAAYNSSPDPGQQLYYNDADASPSPPAVFSSGTPADLSTAAMGQLTIGAHFFNSTNFVHADVQAIWVAWGLPARDVATGKVVAFRNQSVRDRAKPGAINMADGTGITGRAPQIFVTGNSIPAGTNLGTGGNFGTILGTF